MVYYIRFDKIPINQNPAKRYFKNDLYSSTFCNIVLTILYSPQLYYILIASYICFVKFGAI